MGREGLAFGGVMLDFREGGVARGLGLGLGFGFWD